MTESANSIKDLTEFMDIKVEKRQTRIKISLLEDSTKIGSITVRTIGYGCSGAWGVISAYSRKGWGPFLYDLAMEYAGDNGLTCDRLTVSPEAAAVWKFYLSRRSDIITKQLDQYRGEKLTPDDESDDCMQGTFDDWTYSYERPRDENYWADFKEHWSTKAYIKTTGTPMLDKLRMLGRIIEP